MIFDVGAQKEKSVTLRFGEGVERIVKIIPVIDLPTLAKIQKTQTAIKKAKGDESLKLLADQIGMLCPGSTIDTFKGIPIPRLQGLMEQIINLAIEDQREEPEKKTQSSSASKSSRSRRAG